MAKDDKDSEEDIKEIPSFSSSKKKPIKFRIDEDVFECVPSVGGGLLHEMMQDSVKLSDVSKKDDRTKAVRLGQDYTHKVMSFLDEVLLPESQERFAQRLKSVQEPIEYPQVFEVYTYLIQEYSKGRPTTPS